MSEIRFLNTVDAAGRIGLSPSTLEKMRWRGDGPRYHVLGRRRVVYDPGTLDAWVRSREHRWTGEYIG